MACITTDMISTTLIVIAYAGFISRGKQTNVVGLIVIKVIITNLF